MIVDTMNYSEVGAYLLSFAKSNFQRVQPLILHNNSKYRRKMLGSGERRVDFKPIRFESDGIEVYIFPYSLGKREYIIAILFSGMFSLLMIFCFSKFDTVMMRRHLSSIFGTTLRRYSHPIFW